MEKEMQLDSVDKREFNIYRKLNEGIMLQQARERTLLKLKSDSFPSRLKMKQAGWFIVHNENGEIIAVCPYCEKSCKGWQRYDDPYEIHKFLSSNCVFVLSADTIKAPLSPIIVQLPRRGRVSPSRHHMAVLPNRINSFEQWPSRSACPSLDILAEAGLYFIGQGTIVQCFSCNTQTTILNATVDLVSSHTQQCKYWCHLSVSAQRAPLDIRPSAKVYRLDINLTNDVTLYFLRCTDKSKPNIFLSAIISSSTDQDFEVSDGYLKRLCRDPKIRTTNWKASVDGPLVNILRNIANDAFDLRTLSDDQRHLLTDSSPLPIITTDKPELRCRICLFNGNPHIASVICGHTGMCHNQCFSKWNTCPTCGYALGKAVLVYCAKHTSHIIILIFYFTNEMNKILQ